MRTPVRYMNDKTGLIADWIRYQQNTTCLVYCLLYILTLTCIFLSKNTVYADDSQHRSQDMQDNSAEAGDHANRGFIQRQLDQLLGSEESATESGFLIFPTVSYAPETQWDFGLNTLYVYFANDRIENRLSEINVYTFYTQEEQYGLWADHTIYTDHNEWFLYGKARFQYFPMNFFGVGLDATPDVKAVIDSDLIWVRERILKKWKGSLYWGVELDFRSTQNIVVRPQGSTSLTPLPFGIDGGVQTGIGLGLIYDSCYNAMNVRDGVLAELGFLNYSSALSTYPMSVLFFDNRWFFPTTHTQVLALQIQGEFAFGEIPFNQLPTIGGANLMRGYYVGRYRDKRAMAAQVEYRWLPFTSGWRLGGAVFAALGTVSSSWAVERALWSAGLGLRYLLFPQKDIFSRFDYAFTEEGTGAYFYIGESF